jgi:hypothetical protein
MPIPSRKGILPSGRKTRRRFCRERVKDSRDFAKGSFRTVHPPGRPDVNIVMGCRKGYWRNGRCSRSTEAQAILHPFESGHCPRGIYEIVDRARTGGLLVPLTGPTWHALKGLAPIRAYRGKHRKGQAALRRKEELRLRRTEVQRRLKKLGRKARGNYMKVTIDRDFRGGFAALFAGIVGQIRQVLLPPEPPPWIADGSGVFESKREHAPAGESFTEGRRPIFPPKPRVR